MKKLVFKKEKIATLNNEQLQQINGEGDTSKVSTHRGFTCCWCMDVGGSLGTRVPGTKPTVINPRP